MTLNTYKALCSIGSQLSNTVKAISTDKGLTQYIWESELTSLLNFVLNECNLLYISDHTILLLAENFQTLQQAGGIPTATTTAYSHNLQGSPQIQVNYTAGIAKPIARPTAYHPHHPTHPSHPTGPTQHHFTAHAHHTLQLLACRGPYLTSKHSF